MKITVLIVLIALTQVNAKEIRRRRQIAGIFDPFGIFKNAHKAIHDGLSGVGEAVKERVEGVKNVVHEVHKDMQEGVKGIVEGVKKGVDEHMEAVQNVMKNNFGDVHEGIQSAAKVAKLVSEDMAEGVGHILKKMAKKPAEKDYDALFNNELSRGKDILSDILGVLGMNKKSLSNMAMNVLIFVIELITSSVFDTSGNEIPDMRSDESPLHAFLERGNPERVLQILREAQDPMIPQRLMDFIPESRETSSSCIKLLICKVSPVIWGLQHSMHSVGDVIQKKTTFKDVFQSNMPTRSELESYGDKCNRHFPSCNTNVSINDV